MFICYSSRIIPAFLLRARMKSFFQEKYQSIILRYFLRYNFLLSKNIHRMILFFCFTKKYHRSIIKSIIFPILHMLLPFQGVSLQNRYTQGDALGYELLWLSANYVKSGT